MFFELNENEDTIHKNWEGVKLMWGLEENLVLRTDIVTENKGFQSMIKIPKLKN